MSKVKLDSLPPQSLIYLDPPYDPLTATSNFSDYQSHGFHDHDELADTAQKLASLGHTVIVSNHDTGRVRSLYQGFTAIPIDVYRKIGNSNRKKTVPELLLVRDGR